MNYLREYPGYGCYLRTFGDAETWYLTVLKYFFMIQSFVFSRFFDDIYEDYYDYFLPPEQPVTRKFKHFIKAFGYLETKPPLGLGQELPNTELIARERAIGKLQSKFC